MSENNKNYVNTIKIAQNIEEMLRMIFLKCIKMPIIRKIA